MTSRDLYEAVLIEINKENAPNITLEQFNYFANKAVNNYINKRYNIYDINQQTTDDLRVLKATAILKPTKIDAYNELTTSGNMATYEVIMPSDYRHILNCICIYNVKKTYKCYNAGDTWRAAATRLTSDMYSQVLDNFWNQPSYKKPYYYIHNVNKILNEGFTKSTNPTNPYEDGKGTDFNKLESHGEQEKNWVDGNGNTIIEATGTPKTINIQLGDNSSQSVSNVERSAEVRYGNVSEVRVEIRYGSDDSVFELKKVYIDYIKNPQNIRLTQQQIDRTEDTSQMLEYPDDVCQEIVNELVHLIMENISELARLQTHPVVSQSIANPAQQQTEPVAQQQA